MSGTIVLAIISMVVSLGTLVSQVIGKMSYSKCGCMECRQEGGLEGVIETIVHENEKTERMILERLSRASSDSDLPSPTGRYSKSCKSKS